MVPVLPPLHMYFPLSESGRLRSCHGVEDPISNLSERIGSGDWVVGPSTVRISPVEKPNARHFLVPREVPLSTVVFHRVMQRGGCTSASYFFLTRSAFCMDLVDLGLIESPLSGFCSFPWLHSPLCTP